MNYKFYLNNKKELNNHLNNNLNNNTNVKKDLYLNESFIHTNIYINHNLNHPKTSRLQTLFNQSSSSSSKELSNASLSLSSSLSNNNKNKNHIETEDLIYQFKYDDIDIKEDDTNNNSIKNTSFFNSNTIIQPKSLNNINNINNIGSNLNNKKIFTLFQNKPNNTLQYNNKINDHTFHFTKLPFNFSPTNKETNGLFKLTKMWELWTIDVLKCDIMTMEEKEKGLECLREACRKTYYYIIQTNPKEAKANDINQRLWLNWYREISDKQSKLTQLKKKNNDIIGNIIIFQQVKDGFLKSLSSAQNFYENILLMLDTHQMKDDESIIFSLHTSLVALGDLSRYAYNNDNTETTYAKAENYYKQAIHVNPNNGKVFNQLALIKIARSYSCNNKDELVLNCVYYYCRSLACSHPFLSRQNMIHLLEKYYEDSTINQDNLIINIIQFFRILYMKTSLDKHSMYQENIFTSFRKMLIESNGKVNFLLLIKVVILYIFLAHNSIELFTGEKKVKNDLINKKSIKDDFILWNQNNNDVTNCTFEILCNFVVIMIEYLLGCNDIDRNKSLDILGLINIIYDWIRVHPLIITSKNSCPISPENKINSHSQLLNTLKKNFILLVQWYSINHFQKEKIMTNDNQWDIDSKVILFEDQEIEGFLPLREISKNRQLNFISHKRELNNNENLIYHTRMIRLLYFGKFLHKNGILHYDYKSNNFYNSEKEMNRIAYTSTYFPSTINPPIVTNKKISISLQDLGFDIETINKSAQNDGVVLKTCPECSNSSEFVDQICEFCSFRNKSQKENKEKKKEIEPHKKDGLFMDTQVSKIAGTTKDEKDTFSTFNKKFYDKFTESKNNNDSLGKAYFDYAKQTENFHNKKQLLNPNPPSRNLNSANTSRQDHSSAYVSENFFMTQEFFNKRRNSKEKIISHKTGPCLIVLDAPNIAMRHGKNKRFSVNGIRIAFDYFLSKNHKVVAFVPDYLLSYKNVGEKKRLKKLGFYDDSKTTTNSCSIDKKIPDDVCLLEKMVDEGLITPTPPQDYDDSYCIQYAKKHDGCLVTNDLFRDHIDNMKENKDKKIAMRKWLEAHMISFTFVQDEFLPNPDFRFPNRNQSI